MADTSVVRLHALRQFWLDGRVVQRGEIVAVAPLVASDLLDSGRTQLVDEKDREAIASALRTELARVCPPRGRFVSAGGHEGPWRFEYLH